MSGGRGYAVYSYNNKRLKTEDYQVGLCGLTDDLLLHCASYCVGNLRSWYALSLVSRRFAMLCREADILSCSTIFSLPDNFDFRMLSRTPGVRDLDLSYSPKTINDSTLSLVQSLESLRSLNLSGCLLVTARGLAYLQDLPLLSLNLTACTGLGSDAWAILSSFPSLTHLNLSHTFITDDAIGNLVLPGLQQLNLGACSISDGASNYVSKMDTLTSLDLNGCLDISDSSLICLSLLPQLRSLKVSCCMNITDLGMGYLLEYPCLRDLDISCCASISDIGLTALSALTTLRTINVMACRRITNDGVSALAQSANLELLDLTSGFAVSNFLFTSLSCLPNLSTLKLGRCDTINDSGVALLSTYPHLRHLSLHDCKRVTDTSLGALALTSLMSLNISGCHLISDRGMEALSKITTLTSLNVWGCGITDVGLRSISTITSLRDLNLNRCRRITNLGVAYLSALHHIRFLNLGGCSIGDPAVFSLSGLLSLTILVLSATQITNSGIESLTDVPSLHTLDVRSCPHVTRDVLPCLPWTDLIRDYWSPDPSTSVRNVGLKTLTNDGKQVTHLRREKAMEKHSKHEYDMDNNPMIFFDPLGERYHNRTSAEIDLDTHPIPQRY